MDERKKILVIVDMQNDFLTGSLANEDAVKIVPQICDLIKSQKWDKIIATMDTHYENYLDTNEGKHLPIKHCIKDTNGWLVCDEIFNTMKTNNDHGCLYIKHGFGAKLDYEISDNHIEKNIDITIVGTCTDICVVSTALVLKSTFREANITVLENLCAGTTKENHEAALQTMRMCQIEVK